jgi:hypothetical protein
MSDRRTEPLGDIHTHSTQTVEVGTGKWGLPEAGGIEMGGPRWSPLSGGEGQAS